MTGTEFVLFLHPGAIGASFRLAPSQGYLWHRYCAALIRSSQIETILAYSDEGCTELVLGLFSVL